MMFRKVEVFFQIFKYVTDFLVHCDESLENYCHSPDVVVVVVDGVVVRRQKL